MSQEDGKKEGSIKRRDVLKVMGSVPAAALLPAATLARSRTVAAPAAAATAPRKVLTEHEWQTLRVLSDWIIPADSRSGSATAAGVPAFVDDWLDFKGGNLLAEIRGGLTWLDLECHRLFQHDFADCPAAQQKEILDRIAYPRTAAPEDANAAAFFSELRDLVVAGFFSSEMGVKDLPYIGNAMVAHWEGCPPEVTAKIEENEKKLKRV